MGALKMFIEDPSPVETLANTRFDNLYSLLSKVTVGLEFKIDESIQTFVDQREIVNAFNLICDPFSNLGLLKIYSDPREYIKSKFEEIHRILLPASIVSILNSNVNLQHRFNNLVYSIMIGSSTVENYYYLPDYTEKTLEDGISEFAELLTSHLNS